MRKYIGTDNCIGYGLQIRAVGLYKTAAFEKLDNATKERIINVIAHEAIGKDFNGDSVIQNGTKIICNEQTN